MRVVPGTHHTTKGVIMSRGYRDNPEFRGEARWSVGFLLLVLAFCASVLLLSYLGPRPISPSFRATESPSALSGR
jgi:hypothetical protein